MSRAAEAAPARHARIANGTRVAGRYVVGAVLGEGAHSVVYAAHDEAASTRGPRAVAEVALKVIHRHLTGDPQVRRRFEREAKILERLEGEHVVRVFDFVEDDGLLAIALERVDGRSLEAMLAEHAPLPVEVAVEVTLQVCAALGAAHANAIVHRDLKTANVLVEASPSGSGRPAKGLRVKVVDFGLSKLLRGDPSLGLTEQGMIVGTAEYMAPEQARGDEVDARADIYAAGVMLYEMVVGSPPFTGPSPVRTMSAHLSDTPASPRARRPDAPISEALEAVMLRALAKQPDDRFGSARELAEALAQAVASSRAAAQAAAQEIATSDTDLNLLPPAPSPAQSLAHARTLRADELAAAKESVEPPPPPRPKPIVIQEEPTAISGQPLPGERARAIWTAIAVVLAVLCVVVGIVLGTR